MDSTLKETDLDQNLNQANANNSENWLNLIIKLRDLQVCFVLLLIGFIFSIMILVIEFSIIFISSLNKSCELSKL